MICRTSAVEYLVDGIPLNSVDYVTVATFSNDTSRDMRIYLEMIGDEVVLSPGHQIDLLARPSKRLHPLTLNYVRDGVQVFAAQDPDPDWHIRFKVHVYRAGRPTATRLANLEADASNKLASDGN
jgi:hypothetical protein